MPLGPFAEAFKIFSSWLVCRAFFFFFHTVVLLVKFLPTCHFNLVSGIPRACWTQGMLITCEFRIKPLFPVCVYICGKGWCRESLPNTYRTQIQKVTQTHVQHILLPPSRLPSSHSRIHNDSSSHTNSWQSYLTLSPIQACHPRHLFCVGHRGWSSVRGSSEEPNLGLQERPQLAEPPHSPPWTSPTVGRVELWKGLQVPGILLWLWPILLAATRAERDLGSPSPSGETYLEIRILEWSGMEHVVSLNSDILLLWTL